MARQLQEQIDAEKRKKIIFGVAIGLGIILAAGFLYWYAARPLPFHDDDNPQQGRIDATATVRIFSDFITYDGVKVFTLLGKYQDKSLRVIYKYFPDMGNERSVLTAKAAYCSAQQNAFWEYAAILFENNHILTALDWPTRQLFSIFDQFTKKVATIDTTTFSKCIDDAQTQKALENDKFEAENLGITTRPAIFWNNQQLPSIDALEAKLQKL